MTDSEIIKKIAGPFDSNLQGVWLQIITPSWLNGASKSTFPDFHGNGSIFLKSVYVKMFLDLVRAYLPNFVPIVP